MTKLIPVLIALASALGLTSIVVLLAAGGPGNLGLSLITLAGIVSVATFAVWIRRQHRVQAQLQDTAERSTRMIESVVGRLEDAANRLESIESSAADSRAAGTALAELVEDLRASLETVRTSTEKSRDSWERTAKRLAPGKSSIEETTRRLVARDVSAILALHALVRIHGEPHATTGYVASPETLLALVALVRTLPEGAVIVEAGSGLSTVWLALAIEQSGKNVSIVALDHDPEYVAATKAALDRQNLGRHADVRHAQISESHVDGEALSWYDIESVKNIKRIDVLFVDGPPQSTGSGARYPAFPLLENLLVDGAVVILDDTDRRDEKVTLQRWLDHPSSRGALTVERDLDRSVLLRYRLSR